MTPKEKAEYLMKKFISKCNNWNENYVMNSDINELKNDCFNMQWFTPKDVALIAVDEILNLDIDTNVLDYWYWQEVKQEIEKL